MAENQTDQIMIEGRQVEKLFKDFWGRPKVHALRGVDITVPAGTVFGLLGPNGAGKSTLIKIMLGHLYCTSGYMRVIGRNPRDVAVKKRIGYLPERTAFYTNLTTTETLKFFGRLLGIADAECKRRSQQLIKMVGLESAHDRLVGEFSHGMRKRLGLAQALLNDPDLLLLDEPTAGLDPIGCREIKDLILTLGRRGKTILMTSHLLADVQDVCDTIMILYGGRVQSSGEINQLLAKTDELLIRSPLINNATLRKIKEAFRTGLISEKDLEISYPTRSLEDYFVSIVMEANLRDGDTSGAHLSNGIADYLSNVEKQSREAPPDSRPSYSPSIKGKAENGDSVFKPKAPLNPPEPQSAPEKPIQAEPPEQQGEKEAESPSTSLPEPDAEREDPTSTSPPREPAREQPTKAEVDIFAQGNEAHPEPVKIKEAIEVKREPTAEPLPVQGESATEAEKEAVIHQPPAKTVETSSPESTKPRKQYPEIEDDSALEKLASISDAQLVTDPSDSRQNKIDFATLDALTKKK